VPCRMPCNNAHFSDWRDKCHALVLKQLIIKKK
jgi:hypothetical protein